MADGCECGYEPSGSVRSPGGGICEYGLDWAGPG